MVTWPPSSPWHHSLLPNHMFLYQICYNWQGLFGRHLRIRHRWVRDSSYFGNLCTWAACRKRSECIATPRRKLPLSQYQTTFSSFEEGFQTKSRQGIAHSRYFPASNSYASNLGSTCYSSYWYYLVCIFSNQFQLLIWFYYWCLVLFSCSAKIMREITIMQISIKCLIGW